MQITITNKDNETLKLYREDGLLMLDITNYMGEAAVFAVDQEDIKALERAVGMFGY